MTSQARPATICCWLYCSRSCRLLAGMHPTSLCWGWEWSVFDPSSVCLFQTSIGFLVRAWCLSPAAFAVNSRHRTAAFISIHWYAVSIVATRPPKLQVRSRRALWRFRRCSQNKRKRIVFTSDTTAVAFVRTSKRQ